MSKSASQKDAWFARRKPVGHASHAMAPVHWKGWAVIIAFLVAIQIGGVVFMALAQQGALIQGITAFVALTVLGASGFLVALHAKGDTTRSVADYRKAKHIA